MTKRHWLIVIGVALVILAGVVTPPLLRPPPLYRMIPLPSIDGCSMLAEAINDRGQVVGFSQGSGNARLFLWDREHGVQDLGPTCNTSMVDINNRGQIAGTVYDPNGQEQAFFWDPNSGMHLLGTLSGTSSQAHAINNYGWIVGTYYRDEHDRHAFVWDQTRGMRDFGPVDGWFWLGWAINDANQVIVFDKDGTSIVRMDEQGVVQACDRLPIQGLGQMNNSGRMAGTTMVAHRKTVVVCWDPNTGLRTLSTDAFQTGVSAINDADQVLFSQVRDAPVQMLEKVLLFPRQEYFLWDPKRDEIPLNRYVPVGKGERVSMTDINNKGCVLGVIYSEKKGTSRAVLLEPIPERWNK